MSDRMESLTSLQSPEAVIASVEPMIMEEVQVAGVSVESYKKHYINRVAGDFALADMERSEVNSNTWSAAEGFYNLYKSDISIAEKQKFDNAELVGTEKIFDVQISELLKKRKSGDKPVVVLDFGGGWGISMIRLASKYRESVERGDLVFVVTNLGFSPQEKKSANGYTGIAADLENLENWHEGEYTKEEKDFIEKNQQLVQYMDALACELPLLDVDVKGKRIPLVGSVDILNETHALMHTQAPDVALAVFGGLLSLKGTLYLSARNSVHSSYKNVVMRDGRDFYLGEINYDHSRTSALQIGIRILERHYGLKSPYNVTYFKIYSKSDAPNFPKMVGKMNRQKKWDI